MNNNEVMQHLEELFQELRFLKELDDLSPHERARLRALEAEIWEIETCYYGAS